MQKRSQPLGIVFEPYDLDDRCPIHIIADFTKDDAPIRTLHVHDCLEIGICHDGSGILIVGDKVMPYNTGDVTFIAATEVHFSRSATNTHSRWSWINLDPLRLVPAAPPAILDSAHFLGRGFDNVFPQRDNPALGQAVARLVQELTQRASNWDSVVRALTWEIMVLINRSRVREKAIGERRNFDRLAPALQAMAERYQHKWTVHALAQLCQMSEPHFRRVWGVALGQAPLAHLQMIRLQMAAALLRSTGMPILTVSLEVGFESLSSFNRMFRRQFDTTPREWRKAGASG